MKAWSLFFGLILSINFAFADSDKNSVKIQSLNGDLPVKDFGEGYDTRDSMVIEPLPTSMPTVGERDQAFEQVGIGSELEGMDEMDKDLLYLKAKKYELGRLQKSFPLIEPAKLKQLKELIK